MGDFWKAEVSLSYLSKKRAKKEAKKQRLHERLNDGKDIFGNPIGTRYTFKKSKGRSQ